MWILCKVEGSYETSSLIFLDKSKKKKKELSAPIFVWSFKGSQQEAPELNRTYQHNYHITPINGPRSIAF